MCKKILLTAGAILLGLVVLRKTELGSLARVWWHDSTQWAHKQVPVETEIEALRGDVNNLDRDFKKYFSKVAEEEVALENLEKEVKVVRANLEEKERSLQIMYKDVNSGHETISYGDHDYTRKQVENQLKRDWASFKRAKDELKVKEELLEHKKNSLAKAKEQLDVMQEAKEAASNELARLETEMKQVEVAKTRSQFCLDDSRLSNVKERLNRLRDRIAVEKKTIELEGQYANGPINPNAKSSADTLAEIGEHFGKNANDRVAGK